MTLKRVPTETQFKNRIRPKLNALPQTWIVKTQQVALRGTPDFLLCVSGYFVAIELKRDAKARVTELQRYNIDKIIASGGEAFIVSPENWEEVYVKLKNLSEIVI